jgi:hypothetical protein
MTTAIPRTSPSRAGLALALATVLMAAGCAESSPPVSPLASGQSVPRAAVDEHDLVSLLPDSVDSVLTVDLARLRGSVFARPLLTAASGEESGARRQRGFDEIADVDAWAFARVGIPGGDRATLELARGRFDRARVTAAFFAHWPQARPTQFGPLPGVTEANVGVAFVSARVLAFGPPWALRVLAAVGEGKTGSARDLPWLAEVGKALARGRARYRDVDGDPDRPGAVLAPAAELALVATTDTRAELAAAFGVQVPIDHVGARIDVGQAARGLLIATATSPEAAQVLADQLREGLGALRARPSVQAMGLGRMLARGDVAAKGPRVALTLTITAAERENVATKLATFAALLARRSEGGVPGRPSEPEATRQQGAAGQR